MSRRMAQKRVKSQHWLPSHLYEGISSRSGEVVFLNAQNYMALSYTRQEMEFIGHDGQPVRVIHAFPARADAVGSFLKEAPHRLKLCRVKLPSGWKAYSLAWQHVQEFVAHGLREYEMDPVPKMTDVPPQVLKFRASHAVRRKWQWTRCWCGCERGKWEVKPPIQYQVIFAERAVAYVRGKKPRDSDE